MFEVCPMPPYELACSEVRITQIIRVIQLNIHSISGVRVDMEAVSEIVLSVHADI